MKTFLLAILLTISCISNSNGRTSESLKVQLSHGGIVHGRYLSSLKGNGIRAFMGVPYALPPIGELRFKAPQRHPGWNEIREAKSDPPLCIQRDPFRRDYNIEGSEDCLYLNVYTPTDYAADELLPVMVFFHGGGWICGSGKSDYYGPEFLLDHKIIYVGANFRLGPLGFLSTGTLDCPGNNGLKDQVEVLRWIQDHIAAFGGDPGQVTIFGESAGGASGTYHMMSPLSKGLFKQVISQSGVNFNPWAQPAHKGVAERRAAAVGEILKCPKSSTDWKNQGHNLDWATLIDCLRGIPAETLTEMTYHFFEFDTDPMIPFPPVVEPEHSDAFISVHPRDKSYQHHGLGVSWMTGVTADEGVMKSAAYFENETLRLNLKNNKEKALQTSLYYDHHDDPKRVDVSSAIKNFYNLKSTELQEHQYSDFTNLYTDAWFLHGMDEYLRNRLSKTNEGEVGPTYVYLFNHKGAASFTEIFKGGREKFHGVSHAEELQYLFPIGKHLFVEAIPSKEDQIMRDIMVEMWINFARTGNPTPDGTRLTKWKPATSYPVDYMRIGNKDVENRRMFEMERGLLQERADFWMKLGCHLPKAGDENKIGLESKDEL